MRVTSNQENVAPGGLKRSRTWCERTLSMTARQKNAFPTAPPKQDVVRRAPDCDTKPGGGAANDHIRPGTLGTSSRGQDGHLLEISARTESLPVNQRLCPDLTPAKHVTNDPMSHWGIHPTIADKRPRPGAALSTTGCRHLAKWQVNREQTQTAWPPKGASGPSGSAAWNVWREAGRQKSRTYAFRAIPSSASFCVSFT